MDANLKLSFSKFHSTMYTPEVEKNSRYQTIKTDRKHKQKDNPEATARKTLNLSARQQKNVYLPALRDKKTKKKKGTFLESWLDEALGAPEPNSEKNQHQQIEVQGGNLKTIKKFEIDKQYLMSQNIGKQKVQKLYKNLYIYSHGINQLFKQILQFVQQVDKHDLLGNFWQAFIKLLETSTSFQTVFQKISSNQIKKISNLTAKLSQQFTTFQQEKKQSFQQIQKLQREIQQRDNRLLALKQQYSVLDSTLNLTDQSFNQEVHLRLKFQQKINYIYTAYEELKQKYQSAVQSCQIKGQSMLEEQRNRIQLKNKYNAEKIKVSELMTIIDGLYQKIAFRESQLEIKVTQLNDLKQSMQGRQNKEQEAHDTIQIQLGKHRRLNDQIQTKNSTIKGQKLIIKEQKQQISTIKQQLQNKKQDNDQLYHQITKAGANIVQKQSDLANREKKIIQSDTLILQNKLTICGLEEKINKLTQQKNNLKHQLEVRTQQLSKNSHTAHKNMELLQQIKATKDKYERINHILTQEKSDLQIQLTNQMEQMKTKIQEIQTLKHQVEQKEKFVLQCKKTFAQEKQTNKNKLDLLESKAQQRGEKVFKNAQYISQLEKKIDQFKQQLRKSQSRIQNLQMQTNKQIIQLSAKTTKIQCLQKLLQKQQSAHQQLNQRYQVLDAKHRQVSGKLQTMQYLLSTKNKDQSVHIAALNKIVEDYKSRLVEKAQFVHPMIFEEQQVYTARAIQSLQNQKLQFQQFRQQEKQIGFKMKKYQQDQQKYANQIEILKINREDLNTKIEKMDSKIQEMNSQIKQLNQFKENAVGERQSMQKLIKQKEYQMNKKLQNSTKLYERQNKRAQKLQIQNSEKQGKLKKIIFELEALKKQRQKQGEKEKQINIKPSAKQSQKMVIKSMIDEYAQTIGQKMEKQGLNDHKEEGVQTQNVQVEIIKNEEGKIGMEKDEKKVGGKDFKKALKLTFMRR